MSIDELIAQYGWPCVKLHTLKPLPAVCLTRVFGRPTIVYGRCPVTSWVLTAVWLEESQSWAARSLDPDMDVVRVDDPSKLETPRFVHLDFAHLFKTRSESDKAACVAPLTREQIMALVKDKNRHYFECSFWVRSDNRPRPYIARINHYNDGAGGDDLQVWSFGDDRDFPLDDGLEVLGLAEPPSAFVEYSESRYPKED